MYKKTEFCSAAVFLLFSLFAWLQILKLPTQGAAAEDLGTNFFPLVCVYGIALLACAQIARAVTLREPAEPAPKLDTQAKTRILLCTALMLFYTVSYEWAGFYLGTFLFSVGTLLVIGERRPLVLLAFPLGMEAFVYWGFEKVLKVMLPYGDLLYLVFP